MAFAFNRFGAHCFKDSVGPRYSKTAAIPGKMTLLRRQLTFCVTTPVTVSATLYCPAVDTLWKNSSHELSDKTF